MISWIETFTSVPLLLLNNKYTIEYRGERVEKTGAEIVEIINRRYTRFFERMHKFIVGEKKPYEYLIESIKKFPNQNQVIDLMKRNKFKNCTYRNLSGGIVAIHSGWKV